MERRTQVGSLPFACGPRQALGGEDTATVIGRPQGHQPRVAGDEDAGDPIRGPHHVSRADAASLGNCFFPPDNPIPAEVGIVFGMNAPERPARHAIALYQARLVRALLFTGGYNSRVGMAEALAMARMAEAGGVPRSAILIEDQAHNTDENIRFSRHLIERHYGAQGVGSVLLLTIHYHIRRALLAAQRGFPAGMAISWACYPSLHYTAETWANEASGRQDVESEIGKIERYYGVPLAELLRADT